MQMSKIRGMGGVNLGRAIRRQKRMRSSAQGQGLAFPGRGDAPAAGEKLLASEAGAGR